MPSTPKRAGRTAQPESRFISEAVGENIRSMRGLRGLNQAEVAEGMQALKHSTWERQTVGEVEKATRSLTVDELLGLAVVLECTITALLSPLGPDPDPDAPGIDYGTDVAMSAEDAEYLVRSGLPFGSSQTSRPRFRQRWERVKDFNIPVGEPDQPIEPDLFDAGPTLFPPDSIQVAEDSDE